MVVHAVQLALVACMVVVLTACAEPAAGSPTEDFVVADVAGGVLEACLDGAPLTTPDLPEVGDNSPCDATVRCPYDSGCVNGTCQTVVGCIIGIESEGFGCRLLPEEVGVKVVAECECDGDCIGTGLGDICWRNACQRLQPCSRDDRTCPEGFECQLGTGFCFLER